MAAFVVGQWQVDNALLAQRHRSGSELQVPVWDPKPDEEIRLRKAIMAKYAVHLPEFELALHTGMRPSEQYGMTWDRIDLEQKRLTIPYSKNGKTRHIPLNRDALAALKKLPANAERVFATKGYKHWFDKAVLNARIENFTWYSLRHSFASRLVMAGVDSRTVAELMGHQTIQMTQNQHQRFSAGCRNEGKISIINNVGA